MEVVAWRGEEEKEALSARGGKDGLKVAGGTVGGAASCLRAVRKGARRADSFADVEAEKDWWRQRPGMKAIGSLGKPMTQTRNHIRETLLLREENWWINPKSGGKEHLALKYMNFTTEEWTQISLPKEEELHTRLAHPLRLRDPEALVVKGDYLLQHSTWPELVLLIGLNTGRSLAEILKTGVFRAKTAYSILFSGPLTVYEQLCPAFEIPTFSSAELVLGALERVRQMFGMQFAFVERRDVGRQCSPVMKQAAYEHFGNLVPLRPGMQDLYTFSRVAS